LPKGNKKSPTGQVEEIGAFDRLLAIHIIITAFNKKSKRRNLI
jgi:hypothetical protein